MLRLTLIALPLAFVVIVLGAYTRLTDAGLGCPDWPGCYGYLSVPQGQEQIMAAEQAFPERPLEVEKAWNEMIHRYCAGLLGLLVLAIAWSSLRARKDHEQGPRNLPLFLLVLIVFQALLGMWTVTMNLMPVVVMAHLLGGFTTIALLSLLAMRLSGWRIPGGDPRLKRYTGLAMLALVMLLLQISLGGWTSANYAALSCMELPICQDGWLHDWQWSAFHPVSPEAQSYEYGVLGHEARTSIHAAHRIGAIATAIALGLLGWKLFRTAHSHVFKSLGVTLLLLLLLQLSLGVANIVLVLPLGIAVAHNGIAAILLICMVAINYALLRKA